MFPPLRLPRHAAVFLALAIMVPAFLYSAARPINHDVGWFMYAARGMLAGGTLYRDYIDVNAPMAYFTLIPAAWLSNLPFFSNEAALTLTILAYVLVAYILCVAVTRRMGLTPGPLALLRGGILLIMCFMPHASFGQREHLFAVLMMPYILAAGMRGDGDRAPLPRSLLIACGIAAGVGVSIKLPYVLVPAAIEAAVLIRRHWKIAITADLAALVLSTAIIYLFCVALYPAYWAKILPSAVALYGPYDNFWFLSDMLILEVPLFAVAFATGDYRGRGALAGARWMLAAAAIGAFALFIVQRKGWPHHALPILMFVAALCVLNLLPAKGRTGRTALTPGAAVAFVALLGAFFLAFTSSNVDPNMVTEIETQLQGTDGSFTIFSTGNYPAFPVALNRAYRWTSRYPQLIMLPGLADADLKGEHSPYEAPFRAAVVEDLRRGHPARVFVYMPVDAGMPDNYDMLTWFRRDPAFRQEWAHYRNTGTTGPFAVFERIR